MTTIAFLSEPSQWFEHVLERDANDESLRLAPWALPAWTAKHAPSRLRRFAMMRAGGAGRSIPGYAALELASRMYCRGRRDRLFATRFAFRRVSSIWAAAQVETSEATRIYAPSLAARNLFNRNQSAEKVLLLDLPLLRTMHEDLDRAALRHPHCEFLRRYRAPAWAVIQQGVEIAMADRVVVRGRFARQELLELGVAPSAITMYSPSTPRTRRPPPRATGLLRVLLAGLAAARHGTNELVTILETRPWLRVAVWRGEGAEPEEFLSHPQVYAARADELAHVDAVIAPSLCEAYHPDVQAAEAIGIPVIATLRGAGGVARENLMIELPEGAVARGLACALDALYEAGAAPHCDPRTSPFSAAKH